MKLYNVQSQYDIVLTVYYREIIFVTADLLLRADLVFYSSKATLRGPTNRARIEQLSKIFPEGYLICWPYLVAR